MLKKSSDSCIQLTVAFSLVAIVKYNLEIYVIINVQ